MFLKNKNIIFKIRRSKVTDDAALTIRRHCNSGPGFKFIKGNQNIFSNFSTKSGMGFPTMWFVLPAKAQTGLCIRAD